MNITILFIIFTVITITTVSVVIVIKKSNNKKNNVDDAAAALWNTSMNVCPTDLDHNCGVVTLTRNVTCKRNDETVDDSNCDTENKPGSQIECGGGRQRCQWEYGQWSSCNGGNQTRTKTCDNPGQCHGVPDVQRACSLEWDYTWEPCVRTCGEETQELSSGVCQMEANGEKSVVSDDECEVKVSNKLSSKQCLVIKDCVWQKTEEDCNVECGTGTKIINYDCPYPDQCSEATGAESETCDGGFCNWVTTEWVST